MSIQAMAGDKLRPFAHDVQWAVRNYYKDIGFGASCERQTILLGDEVLRLVAHYEPAYQYDPPEVPTAEETLAAIRLELQELRESSDFHVFSNQVMELMGETYEQD